jgi:hypothetical protein
MGLLPKNKRAILGGREGEILIGLLHAKTGGKFSAGLQTSGNF